MSFTRDFRVTPQRQEDARHARLSIIAVALALIALAVVAWILFPPGEGTRMSLSFAAIALAAISVLLLIKLALTTRKAKAFVGTAGEMLELDADGIVIAGDTSIPWHAVTGVWALDSAPTLRARASNSLFGAPGRLMLRAGTNTANVTIGVRDAGVARDPSTRLHRFAPLPSGELPARVELPFGTHFGTAELHDALAAMRLALPANVPVRLCQGALDYAEAWAGTADTAVAITQREAKRAGGTP